jgi:hypothetical protein
VIYQNKWQHLISNYLCSLFLYSFPPKLLEHLSFMFNQSKTMYLVCCLAPPEVQKYDFNVNVEPIAKVEVHFGRGHPNTVSNWMYLYKRSGTIGQAMVIADRIDSLFRKGWHTVQAGLRAHTAAINELYDDSIYGPRSLRSDHQM